MREKIFPLNDCQEKIWESPEGLHKFVSYLLLQFSTLFQNKHSQGLIIDHYMSAGMWEWAKKNK